MKANYQIESTNSSGHIMRAGGLTNRLRPISACPITCLFM